jgi:hypothetical protein
MIPLLFGRRRRMFSGLSWQSWALNLALLTLEHSSLACVEVRGRIGK